MSPTVAYSRNRKKRDRTKKSIPNEPENVTQTQRYANEDFKMNVVRENRYFSTLTNLYAVSDMAGKNSPKFCFQWCKSSLQFARRTPRNCSLDSFTTFGTSCTLRYADRVKELRAGDHGKMLLNEAEWFGIVIPWCLCQINVDQSLSYIGCIIQRWI